MAAIIDYNNVTTGTSGSDLSYSCCDRDRGICIRNAPAPDGSQDVRKEEEKKRRQEKVKKKAQHWKKKNSNSTPKWARR